MRKIFTLLALLVSTLMAMAGVYTDKSKVTIGKGATTEWDAATVTVTEKGDNKYDVAFNAVSNKDGNYTDNYGTVTFTDLEGITANGLTTIDAKLQTGAVTGSDLGITSVISTDVAVKFTADKAYAKMDGLISMVFRETAIVVEFGADDFNTAPKDSLIGEENYTPAGSSFSWDFPVDFKKQYLKAEINLNTCDNEAQNENVFSIGTDIQNWNSGVANGGNIHCYYTKSTKTLLFHYLSANASLGTYRYDIALDDVEGTINVELSYQYGLVVNGKQMYTPARLVNILTQKSLVFGSLEGNKRSNATYNSVRLVDCTFDQTEAMTFSERAKLGYNGAFTRFETLDAEVAQTGLDTYDITVKQVAVGGKTLGDITLKDITGTLNEGEYVSFDTENATATLSNVGELATALGLAEGSTLPLGVNGWIYKGYFSAVFNTTLNEVAAKLSYGIDEPQTREYADVLTTSLNGEETSYEGKTLSFTDLSDNLCNIKVNNVQFSSTGDTDMGTLTFNELPYTIGADNDTIFNSTGLTAELAGCPTQTMAKIENATVTGKITNGQAYLVVEGQASEMPVLLTFGTKPVEPVVFTDTVTVINNGEVWGYKEKELAVVRLSDTKCIMTLRDVIGESFKFEVNTETNDKGQVVYTADNVEAPNTAEEWEGYTSYISVNGKSLGDKFYGTFTIDLGGFGTSYPDYMYTVKFGTRDNITNEIRSIDNAQEAAEEVFSVGGVRQNGLKKGLNIVRRGGKAFKVVKK